jgi:hypothetical protein
VYIFFWRTLYVPFISFPVQQWLHESASLLRYTYIAVFFIPVVTVRTAIYAYDDVTDTVMPIYVYSMKAYGGLVVQIYKLFTSELNGYG